MVAPPSSDPSLLPVPPPLPPAAALSLPEAAATSLATALLLLSVAAVCFILHLHARASRTGPRLWRRLRDLNSLWAVRVLLAAFASLWSLAELLRFPFLSPLPSQVDLCRVYVLASQGFAEPCFFATLLYLLRASVQEKPAYPNAFTTALALALLSSLPSLLLHALFLAFAPGVLSRLGIPPEVFFGRGTTTFVHGARCSYPLFSTALLAGFGAVYVPWFVSACWRAVDVVINKRLRVRLYALTSTVVVGISVQVAALALTAFWTPGDAAFQGLALAAFLGVFFAAVVGEGVLVLCPVADALEAVGWREPPPARAPAPENRREGSGVGAGLVSV